MRVWPIVWAGVGLFALAVVVHLAMLLVLNVFAARESKESPPANPLAGAYGPKAPPKPRLQTEPRGDLEQLHAAEDAALETYGWVDKPAGVVRIPIERAMDLVASAAGAPSGSADARRAGGRPERRAAHGSGAMTRAVGYARLAVASAALAITIAVPAGARAVGGPADARAATVGNAPAVTDAATRPPALREVGIDQRLGEQVPLDLAFRDETGQPVTLRDFVHDKPVVLTLVYYECPMLCTLVLNGLVRAMNVLDVRRRQGVRDRHGELRSRTTRPSSRAAKKATYLDEYRRAGAAGGLAFPDRRPAGDRAPRARGRLSATPTCPRRSSSRTPRRSWC